VSLFNPRNSVEIVFWRSLILVGCALLLATAIVGLA
jgi:hypothetical protein